LAIAAAGIVRARFKASIEPRNGKRARQKPASALHWPMQNTPKKRQLSWCEWQPRKKNGQSEERRVPTLFVWPEDAEDAAA